MKLAKQQEQHMSRYPRLLQWVIHSTQAVPAQRCISSVDVLYFFFPLVYSSLLTLVSHLYPPFRHAGTSCSVLVDFALYRTHTQLLSTFSDKHDIPESPTTASEWTDY